MAVATPSARLFLADWKAYMTVVSILKCGAAAFAMASLLATALPANAQMKAKRGNIEDQRNKKQAELPKCAKPLGTIAISEPETRWWGDLGLGSPEALIRVYVQQSKCFRLVNRSNRGMAAMSRERDLAASGETRRGGTIGKGQMVEADFTVIPDIVTGNSNKGGFNVGGMLGAVVPGIGGALLGGINVKKKSANVILNVVNNKSSEEFVAEGQAKKTDLGWGGGGGGFGGGVFGAAGASGYDNTEIGQVIALAYLDAYTKMVTDLGGLTEFTSAAQSERAVSMKRAGRMFAAASTAKQVKALDMGAMLYPTGNKQNGFWEVEDELGTKGWVPEASITIAK
jgi:curli biogenesis system outer membrane secretion channel CsgG